MDITDPLTRRIHIKMSGCPNGCSQHHIANIGFYGASIKVGEHTIPAYVAHIGGNYEGGESSTAQRLKVRLPAKRVPEAVERWIRLYEAEREDGEEFNAFADARRHQGASRTRSATSRMPVEFGLETMNQFIDWNRKVPVRGHAGRGRVRGLSRRPARGDAAEAAEHERLVFLCSFQKEESVILDELLRVAPHARVVTIDTGVLFPETLAPGGRSRSASACRSSARGRAAPSSHGPGPSTAAATPRSPRWSARWTAPTRGSPASAASRSPTRADAQHVEWDEKRAMWKYNPLAELDRADVWRAHPRARPALPPAARPRLRLDRLRALHAARRRPRGPLGGHRQDRVRPARRAARDGR